MRALVTSLALALATLVACAPNTKGAGFDEKVGQACIDPSGAYEPATCTLHGSKLETGSIGLCTCPATSHRIEAPFCAKGETMPAQTPEYRQAVRAASQGDSSLVGDTYNGKAMCIAPRQT